MIGDKKERYSDDFFTIIPKHIPHTTMSDPGHKCLWNYLFIDFENFCQSSIKDGGTFSAEEIIDAVSKMASFLRKKRIQALQSTFRICFLNARRNRNITKIF